MNVRFTIMVVAAETLGANILFPLLFYEIAKRVERPPSELGDTADEDNIEVDKF